MPAGLQHWLCSDQGLLRCLEGSSGGSAQITEVFVESRRSMPAGLQQWFCSDHDVFVVKPKIDACRAPAVLDSMVATLTFFDVDQDCLITDAEFNAKMLIP